MSQLQLLLYTLKFLLLKPKMIGFWHGYNNHICLSIDGWGGKGEGGCGGTKTLDNLNKDTIFFRTLLVLLTSAYLCHRGLEVLVTFD